MSSATIRHTGTLLSAVVIGLTACDQRMPLATETLDPQFAKGGNGGKKNGGGNTFATFTVEPPTHGAVPSGTGVFGDGVGDYTHQVGGVQAYFGVGDKNAVLVTYGTARTLRYVFDTSSAAWVAAGIPAEFSAPSDFYGVNWSMRYHEMGIGSVGIVQADIEFYVGRVAYELVYYDLAVKRLSATEWLLTTDCLRLDPTGCWNYGFTPSSAAALRIVRRKAQQSYGVVNMPLTFVVALQ